MLGLRLDPLLPRHSWAVMSGVRVQMRGSSGWIWAGQRTWGMTLSQVSMETMLKPSCRAASTSGSVPCENHSVSSLRMSCRLLPLAALPAGHNSVSELCSRVFLGAD